MLYARVFVKILDSSIAENWQARHVFEDMLKLADDGVLDVTRTALARRTNVPIEIINEAIAVLAAPDAASRDPEEDGRRIVRLSENREWGWRIVNWEKYEGIRSVVDQRENTRQRVALHRQRKAGDPSPTPPTQPASETDTETEDTLQKRCTPLHSVTPPPEAAAKPVRVRAAFKAPSVEEIKLQAAKIGLPDTEAEKFFNFYESNGWKVGRNPMRAWQPAMIGWKQRQNTYGNKFNPSTGKQNPRNAGITQDLAKQSARAVAEVARMQREFNETAPQPAP